MIKPGNKPRSTLPTVKEAADWLRCSPSTLRQRIRDGSLAAYKVGGRLLFDMVEIRRFLQATQVLPREMGESDWATLYIAAQP